ncbi:MAG: AbrB/MazE/SpoVT family DNA-binding domain-containing protein [Angelakisella sp.]
MKSTGIVRKVDGLGRVVLPIELRRVLDIPVQSDLEIYVDGDQVILKKYAPDCIFCGSAEGLTTFGDKNICHDCAVKIAALAKE